MPWLSSREAWGGDNGNRKKAFLPRYRHRVISILAVHYIMWLILKSSFFYLRAPYQQSAKFVGVTKNRPIYEFTFPIQNRAREEIFEITAQHQLVGTYGKMCRMFFDISGLARRKVDILVDKREGAKCQEINFKIVFRFEFLFSRR